MATTAHRPPHLRSPRLWVRLATIPLTAVLVLLGLWIFAGLVAPNYDSSIAFGVAWFVVAYVAIRVGVRGRPGVKRYAQLTYAVVGVAIGVWFAVTTFRDVTVSEQIATGVAASDVGSAPAPAAADGGGDVPAPVVQNVELASGRFESLAHGGSGTAAIVRLADGSHVLTFDDLDTDNGPDLRVYLVDGEARSGSVGEFVDLGGLKGNRGDQQYAIPPEVDVSRFDTVSIWCRAFSVGFARAVLAPA